MLEGLKFVINLTNQKDVSTVATSFDTFNSGSNSSSEFLKCYLASETFWNSAVHS